MRFTIQRETLLNPLQNIIGIVERRQTLPILSNVLLVVKKEKLFLTTTDLEIEMTAEATLDGIESGSITLPARKFLDICRALPEEANLEFKYDSEKQRVVIRSGKSRFNLTTLPAEDFPNIEKIKSSVTFNIPENQLRKIINKTHFSMAVQDVRYYLNGLLLEISNGSLCAVATDGHRLAYYQCDSDVTTEEKIQVILPRKGILELSRLLSDREDPIEVVVGSNHIRIVLPALTITSKLIDGRFPDYQRVIPKENKNVMKADKLALSQALSRASILSNEKYRGIRFKIAKNLLCAETHNPEMEEAKEEIEVDYQGDEFEIGFNVSYIIEALAIIPTDAVEILFGDSNGSCLILPDDDKENCKYVVMPMRL